MTIIKYGNNYNEKEEIEPKRRQAMRSAGAFRLLTRARAVIRPSRPTAPH